MAFLRNGDNTLNSVNLAVYLAYQYDIAN